MITTIRELLIVLTKKEKRGILMLSLGSVILSISEAFSIGIIIPIMTLFIDQQKIHTSLMLSSLYRFLGSGEINNFLTFLIVIAIFVFAIRAFFSIFITYLQQRYVGNIYIRLTSDVLKTYLEKPYSFHLKSNSSDLFKNVSLEVSQFITGFLTPIILICSEIIVLLGIFLFLLYVFPLVTILLITVFGLIICSTYAIFKKRIKLYSVQREKYSGQMYKNALEALHAIKEIKIFQAQGFFVQRFAEVVKAYLTAYIKFSVVSVLPRYLFETALVSSMLLSVLFSVLLHRTFVELIPMLTVFGLAAVRLVPSFSKIYSNINFFHYSQNSLDIVYNALKERIPLRDQIPLINKEVPEQGKNSIDLKDIAFCYEGVSIPIIQHLSIAIPLNQAVAIVGLTGSGKSTLIDIIMGLLTLSHGNLYYRGLPINIDNIEEYRRKIGYVPQSLSLIDDTISSNIAFGVPKDKIDSKRLEEVIEVAQLESFIKELPQGVNTQVGERGVRISGGQKQRIGIARALYRGPEIIIFDEATSALDRYTESKLYSALKDFRPGLTIIIVTHRVNTLEHSDHIYVIDSGKIIDQGNFKTLMEKSEVFKKIIQQNNSFAGAEA